MGIKTVTISVTSKLLDLIKSKPSEDRVKQLISENSVGANYKFIGDEYISVSVEDSTNTK